MEDKIFADGLRFERPREGAPVFVKGKLGVHVERFINFLNANKSGEWLNLDLLQSKDGTKLYFQLNTWKPKSTIPNADEAQAIYDGLEVPEGDVKF